ncbi:phage tail assembly protein [Rhizobium glycinendophyticum]|uniref:Phage tail assembly protein n=1 Tax=Rhizobium glycinendophyticum TaxID=2589807 RepID=A0A504U8T9_9HYPH|nr:phage tail assembly protein [Rhizobium glycinendophyticum]TPP07025.1 phage tail assembly protein [Rhizobium glycinendophyticum]
MDTIVKAVTAAEIQAFEARKQKVPATQITPAGFEGSKRVPLTVPVQFDGKMYEAINLRRLKGRDFTALQRLGDDEDMGLLSLISDAPAEVLAELDGDDFMLVSEAAKDFLPRKLREAAEQISGNGPSSQP